MIILLLGASMPVRVYNQWAAWTLIFESSAFLVVEVIARLVLGGLGVWAGWGLLRRTAWATLLCCIAGGACLVDAGYWLYSQGSSYFNYAARATAGKNLFVALHLAGPVLLYATICIAWILILPCILSPKLRKGCGLDEPRQSDAFLWAILASSAGLEGLFLFLSNLMWTLHQH